ncbi:hypothetical protein CROQUDRAFT_726492 [Cronartium quercuum f. sp. fusiforme G11]|uniref:Exoribonuclease phosphorolytic domain-containing protein n=1 Tax=Cronartium quercuum f. sp. fusiforme G11 TaxID=708437 RepID=A0A9P6N907_9BASI|nr:hypothetical protein CROQUDRAFT_726492 [Cronartium quercuum f. sp. fusiforme G11]
MNSNKSIGFHLQTNSNQSIDRRKFNGPDSSTPIPIAPSTVNDNNLTRSDGRSHDDIRPIHIHTSVISSANGSCYIETNQLKLICAVYGPKPRPTTFPKTSSPLLIHVTFSPFSIKSQPTKSQSINDSQSLSNSLHQAILPSLILNSNEIIDLHILILETDLNSNTLSHSILSSTISLSLAGINSIGLVISISAIINSNSLLIDPINQEIQENSSLINLAIIPNLNSITLTSFMASSLNSSLPLQNFIDSLQSLQNSINLIHSLAIKAIQNDLEEKKTSGT